jgi:hypothetical protein
MITSAGEDVETWEPLHAVKWECKLVYQLWETIWKFLKRLKIELPYDQEYHYWLYNQMEENQYVEETSALAYLLQTS